MSGVLVAWLTQSYAGALRVTTSTRRESCILVISITIASLLGCGRTPRDEMRAAAALQDFRDKFNANQCAALTAQIDSRQMGGAQNWLADCSRMRDQLGAWQSLAITRVERTPQQTVPSALRVESLVTFAVENRIQAFLMISHWHEDAGRLRLYNLYLLGGDKVLGIPEPRTPPDIHRDSPPIPNDKRPS